MAHASPRASSLCFFSFSSFFLLIVPTKERARIPKAHRRSRGAPLGHVQVTVAHSTNCANPQCADSSWHRYEQMTAPLLFPKSAAPAVVPLSRKRNNPLLLLPARRVFNSRSQRHSFLEKVGKRPTTDRLRGLCVRSPGSEEGLYETKCLSTSSPHLRGCVCVRVRTKRCVEHLRCVMFFFFLCVCRSLGASVRRDVAPSRGIAETDSPVPAASCKNVW